VDVRLEDGGFLRAIKIRSTTSFGREGKITAKRDDTTKC
jgi:hypothetical protein